MRTLQFFRSVTGYAAKPAGRGIRPAPYVSYLPPISGMHKMLRTGQMPRPALVRDAYPTRLSPIAPTRAGCLPER